MIKLAIAFFALSGGVHAQEIADCLLQAKSFGSQQPSHIDASCAIVIKNSPQSIKKTSLNQSAIALENAIYVLKENDKGKEWSLIGGANTRLEQILDIEINPEEKKLYALNIKNGSAEILTFPSDTGGNLSPRRKLVGEEIAQADAFALDQSSRRLIVSSSVSGWIKAFHVEADPDGRKPQNSLEPHYTIVGDSLRPLALAASQREIAVLETKRALVYEKQSKGAPIKKQTIDLSSEAADLWFDQKQNALLIENQEGAVTVFKKNSEGFYTP